MIKKAILALAITTSFVANADVTLDAHLSISKDGYQKETQRTFVIEDTRTIIAVEDAQGHMLEAAVVESTEDGVVVSFKVMEYDNEGNEVIISEPVLSCTWDQEAVFSVGSANENGDEECIRLTVTASHS